MIGFLRRVFGGHKPNASTHEAKDDPYDAETQEMILSSFDLLEHMQAKGDDLEIERVISHFFFGADRDISRAEGLVRSWGFTLGEREPGRLQAIERAAPNRQWVGATIPMMCRTAGEFDLAYDGWDADPTATLPAGERFR